jgi:hypothetical protein
MYQQLWGYKVEEKLYLGVREQKRLNTTVLEHCYVSKSFATVREACSNAYPDGEVPNKIAIHRLVTKFRGIGSVFVPSRRWWTYVLNLFCKFLLTNIN